MEVIYSPLLFVKPRASVRPFEKRGWNRLGGRVQSNRTHQKIAFEGGIKWSHKEEEEERRRARPPSSPGGRREGGKATFVLLPLAAAAAAASKGERFANEDKTLTR